MASSSGNSSVSTHLQNSGSESDLHQHLIDERKRKRKQSNKESARRSRMRKQKHLDDLTVQLAQLRKENSQIIASIGITTQHYLSLEAENSVLKAQLMELNQRLESLNEIIGFLDNNNNNGGFEMETGQGMLENGGFVDSFANNLNFGFLNQPVMANTHIFQY